MHSILGRLGVVVAVGLLALATVGRADEEKVPLDKLPKAIVKAVKDRFPDAKMVSASTEKEDGKTVYEVAITEKGKKIDVSLTPEGVITGFEKEIAFKDLPKAVAKALEGKYPKATYKIVEEVFKVKDKKEKLEYYEALLTVGKKTVEVEVSLEGKIIKETEKKAEDKDK